MRERGSQEIAARAAGYWTAERLAALTEGKRPKLLPTEAAPLLRALELMNGDGSMSDAARRKYQQITHMVVLLEPAFLEIADRFTPVRVLDAGCGRSYLSYLLAYCFSRLWNRPVELLGVDRRRELIEACRRRFELTGLPEVLRFSQGALEQLDFAQAWGEAFGAAPGLRPNVLVALHACDTATDEALGLGLALRADLLAVAPCCQSELARAWAGLEAEGGTGPFAPIWRSPHLRRETAASVTDAMRTLLLRAHGYEVTAMEFVRSEHTPKNTLLKALRRGHGDASAFEEYQALKAATGDKGIRLEQVMPALPTGL